MGTIVDKFNYSFEAKDLIKDSINNLGGSITSETELKEYAQELDNIYDNLPKTTDTGTNLSLSTIKGKMEIITKGDTKQDGTPTPSTPIDIEVVTGTQEVTISNSDNTETQAQTISLGDIELCKIGTYQDYLYKSNDKWYKKEYIGKYTFTGSETYTTWTNNRVVISNTPNNYLKVANSSIPLVKCTHYTPVTRDNILSSNKSITFYSSSDSAMGTIVNDSDHNTNTLLKEFMTNNDVEIIYVLSTPNDIEITNETLIEQLDNLQKLKSYNGVTNINCSGNLSAILSVSALKGES